MKKAAYIVVPILMVLCFLAGQHFTRRPVAATTASTPRILYYVDPMHPAYKSDKPGIAPDCGMQLVPVYADLTGGPATFSGGPATGAINLSPQQQQSIGLRAEPVASASSTHQVRALGRVTADEARLYPIRAATDGYIQELKDHSTGSLVQKDDELATYGTADILTAQQAFVGNNFRAAENPTEVVNGDWRNLNSLTFASRLRALGMSDIQLKRLAKTMKITDSVQIFSPADGFILARNVSPGQRFEKGTELYRIADLSHVWIVADIYESDAQSFAPGTIATVTLAGHQKPMHARVSQVLPQFDPATRTMKLRLEAENPGFILRPDMFVDIELPVHLPAGLTVPVDSVLDSGMKKHVFLDRGNGSFEAREVETGWRFGDRVQVVKGLAAGDRVVVSGTFLLDSESRLRDAQQRVSAPGDARKALPTAAEAVAMPKTKVAGIPASAIDPACGMPVKPTESVSAGNTESYRGQTYYFCSSACRNKFHADPGHTLSSRTAGSSPQAAR